MDFKDKRNNAAGRDPDFGSIFMSNTATKRECFQRRLLGLPSSQSQFVKQVKAGMILFLFEYEKRQLHGVFEASCDGAMNIVPHAFSSSGKQFPAQVKFIPIWYCKPLPESIFRDAISENYFSTNKFNFGLSENQVHRLLYFFSLRKLELELPWRQLTRAKDAKPEPYPVGKVGRPSDGGIQVRDGKNDRDVGVNNLCSISHKYHGQYVQYNGEPNDIGNGTDMVGKKRRGDAEHGVDTASGCFGDYLSLKDECRFTRHNKEHHYIGIEVRPTMSGGCPRSPSAKVEVYDDDRFPKSDKLMSENMAERDQRMVFSDHNSGLYHSDVDSSVFPSKPILETDSLVQNQLRSIPHPIQGGISNFSCATPVDASSKGILTYDPSSPDLNFRRSPFVRIYDNLDSMQKSISPSNSYLRSNIYPLNNQPSHLELEDINRCQDDSYVTVKDVPFGALGHHKFSSAGYRIPSDVAQNSVKLAAESVAYEDLNSFHFLKSCSVPLPSSDIRNSGRGPEPFPSMFHKYYSPVNNDVQPLGLQENLGHKTCTPVVYGATQMHYGDSLINEHDLECHGNIQNPNFGFPKKKRSVFSRLSFMQDIYKQENGNNTSHGKYDGYASVNEVMEMAHDSHNQWTKKRKLKPLVEHDDAEILRDKTQIISSRLRKGCFAENLKGIKTSDQIAEDIPFVDFKRRSQVQKINEQTKRGSEESEKSEELVIVQKKRRKLVRPNFSEGKTSDDKGINVGTAQNLQVSLSQESSVPKDASESCNALVGNADNNKTDIETSHLICQTHYEDKSGHARECASDEGGTASNRGCISNIGIKDSLECPENFNQNAFSSASSKEKSQHIVEGLCTKDNIKSASPNRELLDSVGEVHHEDKNIRAGRGINIEGGMSDDGGVLTSEVKYGYDCLENVGNENAPIPASCEPGCNIEKSSCLKHLTMHHESESTNFSVVPKESSEREQTEESSEKEQRTFSISQNVDKPYQYFGEAVTDSRMLDSGNQNFRLMGINICVVDGEGKEKN